MDLRGFLTCTALFLCSVDGVNAVNYARQWLQLKFSKYGEIPLDKVKAN